MTSGIILSTRERPEFRREALAVSKEIHRPDQLFFEVIALKIIQLSVKEPRGFSPPCRKNLEA